ncbi:MAG TPA: alpha/beta hydrolase [Candidatus Elarobacter sp.]
MLLAVSVLSAALSASPPSVRWGNGAMLGADGSVVRYEAGELDVPELRSRPSSRLIPLRFARLRSTGASGASPIVYLAGGPGGSGIEAMRQEIPSFFTALREAGDVVALDQRGTGASNAIPFCPFSTPLAPEVPITRAPLESFLIAEAQRCAASWRSAGVELGGYTTRESVLDLDELRRALGAERLRLVALSYGTQLALDAVRVLGPRIERVVLVGSEQPGETVKLPARTDAYLARLGALAAADPAAPGRYPDLVGTMRRVLADVDRRPRVVEVRGRRVAIGGFELRLATGALLRERAEVARVPELYRSLAAGDDTAAAAAVARIPRGVTGLRGMPEAVLAWSGIEPDRLATVRDQTSAAALEDALNFPAFRLQAALGVGDAGADYRAPVRAGTPALFAAGDLDGRTYIEDQRAIAAGFPNASFVEVRNGGHSVFRDDPRVVRCIVDFLRGLRVPSQTLALPPPSFSHPDS